jgi:hypothetical protein
MSLDKEMIGMVMKQEWFSAKELIGLKGLPTSTQGIHGMARRQSWVRRRRRGVQGRAVEYHIDSLPSKEHAMRQLQEPTTSYTYQPAHDPLAVWIESYKQLHEHERQLIISFIVREGLTEMIKRLRLAGDEQ